MLRRLLARQYFCGLDVGSQTIKAGLIKGRKNHTLGLLGVNEVKTSGFKKASVTDLGELSECIHAALSGLARKTGVKLNEVQLGIGGELIETRLSSAVIPLVDKGSKVIGHRDVKKIQSQARFLGINMEETVLHNFPQYYKVDDVNTALNPIGLYGRKLAIHSLLIVTNNTLLKNLTKAVNQSGYDVSNLYFTSLSSTEVSLNEYQRRQGCIFIDIGSAMTHILIFQKGQLKHLVNIPLGGDEITRGIADHLGLAFDLAEEIKKSHALVLPQPCPSDQSAAGVGEKNLDGRSNEDILIKREGGYLPIKRKAISQAIEPVVSRLTCAIVETIKAQDIDEQANAGIVMAGGGALLPGLPERIEEEANLPVKIGKVNIAVKRLRNAAKYSSAVGLAKKGWQEAFGLTSHLNGHLEKASSLVNRVKELYQEYF